jgi:hypothetical protein
MTILQSQDIHDTNNSVDFPIPDSNTPVKMNRLHIWNDGTSVLVVNFPAGWSRPIIGSYECAEEFIMLEGELHMSGEVFRAGDHAWVPPHSLRIGTSSPNGATALAWFYGRPKWSRQIDDEGSNTQIKTTLKNDFVGEVRRSEADGVDGHTMKFTPGSFTAPTECEVISLPNFTWSLISAGSQIELSDLDLVRLSK